jgi:hypothetical protein
MTNRIYLGFMDELIKQAAKESAVKSVIMSPVRATTSAAKDIGEAVADAARAKVFGLGERIKSLTGKHDQDQLLQNMLLRARLEGKSPEELQKIFKSVTGIRRQLGKLPEDTKEEMSGLFEAFGQGKAGQSFAQAAAARGAYPHPERFSVNLPLLGLTSLGIAAAVSAMRAKKKAEEEAKSPTSSDQG